ncbi:aminotransferase class III-fold pyridoxal phosphate-dependent enzyme [Desulfobacula sp.]|uniref:aminotransferase family protein n=1 Tax=Desulfobacula sp. TaxID=2593537 RepID=UPI00261F5A03|nr:aminotransferase class III-fold pyridoxal phosphate-dependent enzyme [Desulfobacula sp.]
MEKNTSKDPSHVFHFFLNREYISIAEAKGIYLYDDRGNRYIDASGGPILCNLGHGIEEMATVIADQAKKVSYVHRIDFTNPPLIEAAHKVCQASGDAMDKVFFVSGGTEAVEIGVKIARKYHLDNGAPFKTRVISRWQSYHGSTAGALAWTGATSRRSDFLPYLHDFTHIPPAYCYRCWFDKTPDTCHLECANALENEIMCLGPDNVSVFLAEPVSGMSLCGAVPAKGYFKRIREICDTYDVLLMFDEVMTGMGRTGKMFAYEHFDVVPDILALGKGLGGGYFPIGAVAVPDYIHQKIAENSGMFGAGHSWGGNPLGCAVVSKTIDYLYDHNLIDRSHQMGMYLDHKLQTLKSHPLVGDIRGIGLMRGIEFVEDKKTRKPLDSTYAFSARLSAECLKQGMFIEYSGGCNRGQSGDMIMFGPPFIITEAQIDAAVEILGHALEKDLLSDTSHFSTF